MSTETITTPNPTPPTRYFQFIAGERRTQILIFDKVVEEDGMIFLEFKDGSRCNEEYVAQLNDVNPTQKMIAEIEHPNNCWTFKTEYVGREEERWEINADGVEVCVIPFNPGKEKITPIPPRPSSSKFGNIVSYTTAPQPVVIQEPVKVENPLTGSPVWLLADKAIKRDINFNMDLILPLPDKSLYDVSKSSFENGGEDFIEYIIEKLDIMYLKTSLRDALSSYYETKNNIDITNE